MNPVDLGFWSLNPETYIRNFSSGDRIHELQTVRAFWAHGTPKWSMVTLLWIVQIRDCVDFASILLIFYISLN